MASTPDDLDATRAIVQALSPFDKEDQMRIIRWAFEKLNITLGPPVPQQAVVAPPPLTPHGQVGTLGGQLDIKSFVKAKAPGSDMQFAATIAYFYAFEAQESQKKSQIGSDDLQEACRLTGRERLANPGQTLRNSAFNGLLDKGAEKGTYKINTVGENLVALTLPSTGMPSSPRTVRKKAKKTSKSVAPTKPNKKAAKKVAKKSAKKKVGNKSS